MNFITLNLHFIIKPNVLNDLFEDRFGKFDCKNRPSSRLDKAKSKIEHGDFRAKFLNGQKVAAERLKV